MITLFLSVGIGFGIGYTIARGLTVIGCPPGIATSIGGYIWIGVSVCMFVLRLAKWSAEKCPGAWEERGLDKSWWDGYQERAHQLAEQQRAQAEADGIATEHTSGFARAVGRLSQPRPVGRLTRQPRHVRRQEPAQAETGSDISYAPPARGQASGQMHQPAPQDDLLDQAKKQQERQDWDASVKANRAEQERQIREQEQHRQDALRKVEEFNRAHGAAARPQPQSTYQRQQAQAHYGRQLQDWQRDANGNQFANAQADRIEQALVKQAEERGEEFAGQVEQYIQAHGVKGAAWAAKQGRRQG